MRLFIAEKPDLAKAIVAGLGGGIRKEGYYDCGKDIVTWCYGHMLQLLEPQDYDERYSKWQMDDLPIVHIPWRKKPGKDKKEQLTHILNLLKKAEIVVNAGDPDEEGQLLVDEILAYANYSLPVKRLLINDNNTKIVQKALSNLKDNEEFAGLSACAEARSVGDQLYGYNLTRAYTLAARQAGYSGVLSVGRVQTPILGMVVRRCRAFKMYQKAFYYNVTGKFDINGTTFPARYQVNPFDPVDEKKRLIDEAFAQNIANSIKGKGFRIVSFKTQQKEQFPPLPYNLLKLQTDASRQFGFKPDKVKDITQVLREKYKLITYNRSDCEYLSDEQHLDANAVLNAISHNASVLSSVVTQANPKIKSRTFDSSKVSAHHAIIPTEAKVNWASLPDDAQKIYLLIARAYVAQFWENHAYDQTNLTLEIEQYHFEVCAKVTTLPGWTVLYKKENEETQDMENTQNMESIDIRSLKVSDKGICITSQALKMETKPQPLYTMAALLTDLTRVAKYIRDTHLRKLLQEKDKDKEGEHGGIGTPATRDSIIKTLFDRNYLIEKNKNIVASDEGEAFYDALPDQAKYPDMTALWHEQQKNIKSGARDPESFIHELMAYITQEVNAVKQNGIGLKSAHNCTLCQKPLRRIKGSSAYFWGCTGYTEGCKFSCDDDAGKPLLKESIKVSVLHKCTNCNKGLSRRSGKKKGEFWWGCSGYPHCKQTYSDVKGKPDYAKKPRSAA